MEPSPLAKAIEIAGSQLALAKAIGRRQSRISDWLKRGWPSPDAAMDIEKATGVPVAELLQPLLTRRKK
jgi:DNA-binding transcriptional regulator YdaS (Cro superfamily)